MEFKLAPRALVLLLAAALALPAAAALAGTSPTGSGPLPAVMVADPSLPTHTLYRPEKLPATALPVVAWANGGCINDGTHFNDFLAEIASYGYLVIAIGPIPTRPVDDQAGKLPPPPTDGTQPKHGPPTTHSRQLLDAITWASRENERSASAYYHHLDLAHVAVMGQSCGGAQALEASVDPRVTTTVLWNAGLWNGVTDMSGGVAMTKDYLQKLHAPVAYISGDAQDIAFDNANDDFRRITHVPALRAWRRSVPHSGTYHEHDGGEYGGVAVAWLDWQLKASPRAAKFFLGKDCGLCLNPRWVVDNSKLH